jgi:hypothetical protein
MKNGRKLAGIALIVASVAAAAEPPSGILRKIAERETATARARENYTFRQSVSVQEFDVHGAITGEYGEVRDITFSPKVGRFEKVIVPGHSTLTRVRLTKEDFNDIRNIQPFLFSSSGSGPSKFWRGSVSSKVRFGCGKVTWRWFAPRARRCRKLTPSKNRT